MTNMLGTPLTSRGFRSAPHSRPLWPIVALVAALLLGGCASAPATESGDGTAEPGDQTSDQAEGYDQYETTREAVDFLGGSAEGIARAIDRAFADHGRPNAIIKGEEGGGAFVVGLRYGKGEFLAKSGERQTVYWQGPSVGWDFGGDGGRVFMLVYNLPRPDLIFQRFAGVNGSAFVVGGVGMQYLRSQSIVVAPIRVGVGLRLGAGVGYTQFTQDRSYNPF